MYSCFLTNGKTKHACKGVRISPAEIERVAKGEEIIYRSEAECFSLKRGKEFIERKVNRTAKFFDENNFLA